jgi:hypothetical protein
LAAAILSLAPVAGFLPSLAARKACLNVTNPMSATCSPVFLRESDYPVCASFGVQEDREQIRSQTRNEGQNGCGV